MAIDLSYTKFQSVQNSGSSGLDLSFNAFQQSRNVEPKPNFTSKVKDFIFNSGFINTKPIGLNVSIPPKVVAGIGDFFSGLYSTYEQTPSKIIDTIKTGASDLQKSGILSTLPKPLGLNTPSYQGQKALAKIVLGTAGNAANAIFAPLSAAIGAGLTQTGGQKIIDSTGQTIADKSGITNMPAFQQFAMNYPNAGEYFNNALMLIMSAMGGAKDTIDPKKMWADTKKTALDIINNSPKQPNISLPIQSQNIETNIPISTSKTRYEAYRKEMGYEPYAPTEQLPTIEMGAKTPETLPTIQIGEKPSNRLGSMTIESIKTTPPDLSFESFKVAKSAEISKPTEPITSVETILPPREFGVTKTASDINQNLVKEGFDALPAEEQAKYTPQSYKEVAQTVAKKMDVNIEEVKSMAKGDIPISSDIKNPEILFNAVEAYAMKNADTQLLVDLAKSPVSQTSRAGQILGGHGFNDNPNSVVKVIQEVNTSREKATIKNKPKIQVIKEEKANLTPIEKVKGQTWSEFIDSIIC